MADEEHANDVMDAEDTLNASDASGSSPEPVKKTKLPKLAPSTRPEEPDIQEAQSAQTRPTSAPSAEAGNENAELIFALRTTANKEDQVMDFIVSNAAKKGLQVYSVARPHGMRGYIFLEAATKAEAEQAAANIPYARGILAQPVRFKEMEHMLEQVKVEANIQKDDIAEIISGPFKREKCKVTRVDRAKEEVVVELLEAAVPIPITLKFDAIKVIRREGEESGEGKTEAEEVEEE